MLEGFYWKKVGHDWLLYHKGIRYNLAVIHTRLFIISCEYYIDIYINRKHRLEFTDSDLDVAKLKAEIKTAELLKKGIEIEED